MKRRRVIAWAIVRKGERQPIRVFWGRFVARIEAKSYPGARVVRCEVSWDD